MTAKCRDENGDWRCQYVGFRVSPEEKEIIQMLARDSGMNLREYIRSKLALTSIRCKRNNLAYQCVIQQLEDVLKLLEEFDEKR